MPAGKIPSSGTKHAPLHPVAPPDEQESLESETLRRALFELVPSAVVLFDEEGTILQFNERAHRQLGYTRDEFATLRVSDVDAGEAPEIVRARIARVFETGGLEFDSRHRTRTGEIRRMHVKASPVEIRGKRRIVAVWQDITERERAEELLQESEQRFRAIFEQAAVGMAHVDVASGRFLRVNDKLCEIVGYSREDMLSWRWQDLTHPDDLARDQDSYARMLATHRSYSKEKRYVRKDGNPVWVNLTVAPMWPAGAEPTSHVAVMEDITEKKRLEEQYRQAQKLESVGRLAGGIAHDFNNLLTVILSGAEALRDAPGDASPSDREIAEEIAAAGHRARGLTRQLLAFARRQVIAPVPLDLNALVRGSEALLRRVLGEDVELVTSLEAGLWPICCDPGQIEQIVLNLAVNARDAMPRGGRLTLSTANVEGAADPARPPALRGPHVRLSLRDSGVGMSQEVKAHLFEPFFTTKPPGQGTGLGLATVYGVVKQNEGQIRVESEVGRGTTFDLCFPRTAEAPPSAAPSLPVAASSGSETVLVVEDDPQVREVTVRSLRAGGYRVLVAADGPGAVEAASREPSIDLLLTDVVMPGMSGREVADELCRRHAGLRVLYVSGYAQDAIAQRGVLETGVELLQKPFTASSLLARVRAVLDSR